MAAGQRRSPFSRYQLQGVAETGREIGRGSYAVVEELDFRGLSCVGKSIHRELYDNATDDAQAQMLGRFADECELLSQVRHPNIVQFLGVYFKETAEEQGGAPLPAIVMERLQRTLTSAIERHGRLPDEICHSVFRDVATGLAYLHARPVVHRDLSANNVLLTPNMYAKISDLGVAKILDLSPARMSQMTTCPGTPSYMPPEALASGQSINSTKVDIFSFGNLMTHVLSGQWPIPTEVFRFDPSNPNAAPVPLTEVERREEYLQGIGEGHPLMGLIRQCLSNNPAARPEAEEILRSLDEQAPQHPTLFTDRVEALQRVGESLEQAGRLQREVEEKEEQAGRLQREVDEKEEQAGRLQREVEEKEEQAGRLQREKEEQVGRLQREVEEKEEQAGRLQREVEEKEEQAGRLQREGEQQQQLLTEKDREIEQKHRQIEDKDQRIDQLVFSQGVELEGVEIHVTELRGECEGLKTSLRAREEEVEAAEAMARAREREAAAKEDQLSAVRQELAAKEKQLETKSQQLSAKEAEVASKQQEVVVVRQELAAKEELLETKSQQLFSKDQQLSAKEAEVGAKERELGATRYELAGVRVDRDAQKEAIDARDSQLRAKEREMAGKEGVLAFKESTIAQLRNQASMSLLLNPQSKLRWRRRADMPGPMVQPHVVRINNDIYAGGGDSRTHAQIISRYCPAGDTWFILPKCPTASFGLTQFEGKPVLVGGIMTGPTPTNDVYTLENSREWRNTLPPLPTARICLTVFRYQSFLIACGGITSWTDSANLTCTSAVEVFSSKTSQWYKAEPLPTALHAMSYTIINDTCYLIGGVTTGVITNRAFCASLPSLIQQATAQANPQFPTASSSPPSAIWRELPDCPCYSSTAAGLGGCLLAIGGQLPGSTDGSTLVYLYSPSTNSWVRVSNADIPEPQYYATATQLANGDIILVGGKVRRGEPCNTVFVGSIEF